MNVQMIRQLLRLLPFIAVGITIVILIIVTGWYIAREKKKEKEKEATEQVNIRCMVCGFGIKKQEQITSCPLCDNFFHGSHIREWLKTKGRCPVCKEILHEKDLVKPQMI